MKFILPLLALASLLCAQGQLEQSWSITLQVGDRAESARRLVAQAESLGGYVLQWEEWSIQLRLPAAQLQAYRQSIAAHGSKSEESYHTTDLGESIADLEASLRSQHQLLAGYYSMVKSSNTSQMLQVERAIIELVAKIELAEGRLRAMRQKVAEGLVQIHFRYQDRELPPPSGTSPYTWINALNLADHRGAFP